MSDKAFNIGVTFAIGFALIVTFYSLTNHNQKELPVGAAGVTRIRSGSDISELRTNAATTTPSNGLPTTFITSNAASSTLTFDSEKFSNVNVQLLLIATRTVRSFLEIARYTSDNGIDFYPYNTLNSNGAIASSSPIITWLPSVFNGTTTAVVDIGYIPAKKTRLVFGLGTTTPVSITDSVGFHANVIGQIE